MNASTRHVMPEFLDRLPADDPQACRSRRDLMRIHYAMRSVAALRRTIATLRLVGQPRRILELGAGDGSLLLRSARTLRPRWTGVELTLLDRLDLVSQETREAYRHLDWSVTVHAEDVLDWSLRPGEARFDLCICNLFLHHFDDAPLRGLLGRIAAASDAFVACEPRRNPFSGLASRMVILLGANQITREDAVTSVAAGFAGAELSLPWLAASGDWRVAEFLALPFTHCFSAARSSASA